MDDQPAGVIAFHDFAMFDQRKFKKIVLLGINCQTWESRQLKLREVLMIK